MTKLFMCFRYRNKMQLDSKIISELKEQAKAFLSHNKDKSLSIGASSFHFFYTASNSKEYVVLIPKYEKSLQDYKKQAVLLPFLQKLNLPVLIPNEIEIIEDGNLIFAVEEKINGNAWSFLTYANFDKAQKKNFSRQIANFLFQLHQTPTDNLPACSFDDFFVFPDKKTLHEKLSWVFTDEMKKDSCFIERIWEKAKIIFDLKKDDTVFMHRDFCPQNTFIDKNCNLYAVIDWAACCIAPRIREFQNLAGSDDRQLLIDVLQNYNEIANTNILHEQVVLFNHIEWIACLDILKDRPSLQNWAKKDGTLLASGQFDKQIENFV